MKLAQLSLALPSASAVGAAHDARPPRRDRLGLRQVTALTTLQADPEYALQELLDSVQQLAQGPFVGEAQMRAAAAALAVDLAGLGKDASRLLQPQPPERRDLRGVDLQA